MSSWLNAGRKPDAKRWIDVPTVLDASALIAHLNDEQGKDRVTRAIAAGAAASTVSIAEVYGKLGDAGLALADVAAWLGELELEIFVFTEQDAFRSGQLRLQTAKLGLSLGDRACIALAERLNAPVLTADRAWKNIAGVRVKLIR